ncbi:MAG: hypothetical protein ACLQU3_07475 [Limisphaerales bacterium]
MKPTRTPAFAALRRGKQNLLAAALVGALACTATSLTAQDGTNAVETAKPAEPPERPAYRPLTLGLEAGTDGLFGGSVAWRFSDHLGVRAGADYTETSWNHLGIAGLSFDAKVQLLSEPLILDIYPWKKHSFHIGLGALFNQNELSGTATSDGTISINGQPVVGSITMSIKQQPVNPYLTIGGTFFYFDHAHHWGFGGELGVAYTGDSKVGFSRSGGSNPALDDALHDALHRYGNQFQWWPVLKLAVTYSF